MANSTETLSLHSTFTLSTHTLLYTLHFTLQYTHAKSKQTTMRLVAIRYARQLARSSSLSA